MITRPRALFKNKASAMLLSLEETRKRVDELQADTRKAFEDEALSMKQDRENGDADCGWENVASENPRMASGPHSWVYTMDYGDRMFLA